jgi:hypothetical protein
MHLEASVLMVAANFAIPSPIGDYSTIATQNKRRAPSIATPATPTNPSNAATTATIRKTSDISERKAAQEQQRLLFREMNHRIKNLMTTASTMVTLSKAGQKAAAAAAPVYTASAAAPTAPVIASARVVAREARTA